MLALHYGSLPNPSVGSLYSQGSIIQMKEEETVAILRHMGKAEGRERCRVGGLSNSHLAVGCTLHKEL